MYKLLVIGFDEEAGAIFADVPGHPDIETHTVRDGYEAMGLVEKLRPDMAFLNIEAPGPDGVELLRNLREIDPDLQVIAVCAHCGMESAIEVLELGASDFLPVPAGQRAVQVAIRRAKERIWMRAQLEQSIEEIQKRDNFERKLIVTSIDGIIANNRAGGIILFNEGASRIYGYAPEEATSELHVTRLYPEGEAKRIKKMIYGPEFGGPGRLINYETQALTRDGKLTPILLSATLLHEGQMEVGTVGYFKDLTEIRHQSARLVTIDKAVAEMDFGLRDIIQGMKLGAFLVDKGIDKEEWGPVKRGSALVIRNIDRISRLTFNLLNNTRAKAANPIPVSLNSLATAVCGTMAAELQEKGILVEMQLAADLPNVPADPEAIHNCIFHLVSNAVEAFADLSEGGRIVIRTWATGEKAVCLEVEDNGCGIRKELKEEIFRPFFTTKGGSGLGLTIVRKIVADHNGSIRIDSAPGGGASFTVMLPAAR